MSSTADSQCTMIRQGVQERRWPHLIVIQGPGQGRVFRMLRPETTIGRAADSDILLATESVSRRHALVRVVGTKTIIEDRGSRNGTFVGSRQVKRPRQLEDGALITIGDSVLLMLTYTVVLDEALGRAAFERACRDPVTNLASTLLFIDRLRSECAHAARRDAPLTLIFFRVDGLVAFSKREGGDVAMDRVMMKLARLARATVRVEDLLARTADDELVALVRSDVLEAAVMAERLRRKVAEDTTTVGEFQLYVTAAVIPLDRSIVLAAEAILIAARKTARNAMTAVTNHVLRVPALDIRDPVAGDDQKSSP